VYALNCTGAACAPGSADYCSYCATQTGNCTGCSNGTACRVGAVNGTCQAGVCIVPCAANQCRNTVTGVCTNQPGVPPNTACGRDGNACVNCVTQGKTCNQATGLCEVLCGNGVLNPGETCDIGQLNGHTCVTEGFAGGSLLCNATCTGFNTSGCTTCGNGTKDGTEQCDGADLGGATCVSQGVGCEIGKHRCVFAGTQTCTGTTNITCNANCTLNTSQCLGVWTQDAQTLPDANNHWKGDCFLAAGEDCYASGEACFTNGAGTDAYCLSSNAGDIFQCIPACQADWPEAYAAKCTSCTLNPAICNDGNACTTDSCVGGVCQNPAVAPGTNCGGTNVCCGTTCGVPKCENSGQCNDGNPGTTDTCITPGKCTGACSSTAIVACVNGDDFCPAACTQCNDNNCPLSKCTGLCCGLVCVNPCTAGSCPVGQICRNPGLCAAQCVVDFPGSCEANGDCNSPPECKTGGSCNTSTNVCTYGNAASGTVCTVDAKECTNDQCDGSGNCAHPNKPSGTVCTDDGNQCTIDQCDATGNCMHPNQPAGTPCAGGTCNGSGVCAGECTTAPDGTGCTDDTNTCTNDICQGGSCAHPNKITGSTCASDGNDCTIDECDGSGSCTHTNASQGTDCNSGKGVCNATGTCRPFTYKIRVFLGKAVMLNTSPVLYRKGGKMTDDTAGNRTDGAWIEVIPFTGPGTGYNDTAYIYSMPPTEVHFFLSGGNFPNYSANPAELRVEMYDSNNTLIKTYANPLGCLNCSGYRHWFIFKINPLSNPPNEISYCNQGGFRTYAAPEAPHYFDDRGVILDARPANANSLYICPNTALVNGKSCASTGADAGECKYAGCSGLPLICSGSGSYCQFFCLNAYDCCTAEPYCYLDIPSGVSLCQSTCTANGDGCYDNNSCCSSKCVGNVCIP
ncbi:MAG: hypothetical protein UY52_C0043G0001, partial [Parcubacteria group bacterium GW2011_GWC2_49_9]